MAGSCFSKPTPPPDHRLVGVWILNPESLEIKVVKRGDSHIVQSQYWPVSKLTITQQGWIKYAECSSKNFTRFAEGPAIFWTNHKIRSGCGFGITPDYSGINEGIVSVRGFDLYKA